MIKWVDDVVVIICTLDCDCFLLFCPLSTLFKVESLQVNNKMIFIKNYKMSLLKEVVLAGSLKRHKSVSMWLVCFIPSLEGKNKLDFIYNKPKPLNTAKATIIMYAMHKIICQTKPRPYCKMKVAIGIGLVLQKVVSCIPIWKYLTGSRDGGAKQTSAIFESHLEMWWNK